MPTIYLRVSRYEAAFLRTPDGDGDPSPSDFPISFSKFSPCHHIISNGLVIIPEAEQWRTGCYGQRAWENMCRCCPPQGGKPLLSRLDSDGWPSYREIRYLDGMHSGINIDSYEYIGIAVPSEAYDAQSGRSFRVTKSHSLNAGAAKMLRREIHRLFVMDIVHYVNSNDEYCATHHISRFGTEALERYFADHCIPVSFSGKEKESMRRQIRRWLDEANTISTQRAMLYGDSITRVGEADIVSNSAQKQRQTTS